MKQNNSSDNGRHEFHLKNRNRLNLTGVREVISYNEKNILLDTTQGTLVIKGKDLKLKQLNLENSKIRIKGHINLMNYKEQKEQSSFFEKLFK